MFASHIHETCPPHQCQHTVIVNTILFKDSNLLVQNCVRTENLGICFWSTRHNLKPNPWVLVQTLKKQSQILDSGLKNLKVRRFYSENLYIPIRSSSSDTVSFIINVYFETNLESDFAYSVPR